jgi:hypothetical protein
MCKRCGYQARCREQERQHLCACAHTAPAATTCQVQHSFISNPTHTVSCGPATNRPMGRILQHTPAGARPHLAVFQLAHKLLACKSLALASSQQQTLPATLPKGSQCSRVPCSAPPQPGCGLVMVLAVCLHTCVLLQTRLEGSIHGTATYTQRGHKLCSKAVHVQGSACCRESSVSLGSRTDTREGCTPNNLAWAALPPFFEACTHLI